MGEEIQQKKKASAKSREAPRIPAWPDRPLTSQTTAGPGEGRAAKTRRSQCGTCSRPQKNKSTSDSDAAELAVPTATTISIARGIERDRGA